VIVVLEDYVDGEKMCSITADSWKAFIKLIEAMFKDALADKNPSRNKDGTLQKHELRIPLPIHGSAVWRTSGKPRSESKRRAAQNHRSEAQKKRWAKYRREKRENPEAER
jgi:hypothetical protein